MVVEHWYKQVNRQATEHICNQAVIFQQTDGVMN